MAGPRLIDETGKRYGRLVVQSRAENGTNGQARWLCTCDCGGEALAFGSNLRRGHTESCGCIKSETTAARCTTHGECGSIRWAMLRSAKQRARRKGVPFDLCLDDLPEDPGTCPVLGVSMSKHNGKPGEFSPSIDRVVPEDGYVPGNVRVISHRANWIKSNSTPDETMKVAAYQMGCPDHLAGWTDFEQDLGRLAR